MKNNDKPEDHTGYLLWQITSIRQRKINNALKCLELTYPQFVIISGIQWLNRSTEKVNQVQLIQFTKMDKSVVSSVLKSLEKRDVVIRNVDEKDTRSKTLDLSLIGKNKLEESFILIKNIDEIFFDKTKYDINNLNKTLSYLIQENK